MLKLPFDIFSKLAELIKVFDWNLKDKGTVTFFPIR